MGLSTAYQWNRTYGGTGSEEARSLVQTVDGGYAIAGHVCPPGGSGPYASDAWLVKTDSEGRMEWNRTYGGMYSDTVCSLVRTSDDGYAMAGSRFAPAVRDFWVVKTDSAGNVEWERTYGGVQSEKASSLVQTLDGGYAIAGYTMPSGGKTDFWLVKIDSTGNMEWNRTYGGFEQDIAHSLVQTADGGYALAGHTYSFGGGECDAWLVKTDSMGNLEWNRTYGGDYEEAE